MYLDLSSLLEGLDSALLDIGSDLVSLMLSEFLFGKTPTVKMLGEIIYLKLNYLGLPLLRRKKRRETR